MTHEELLARINEIATVKFSEVELESTWTRLCKLPEALRAVVELLIEFSEDEMLEQYKNSYLLLAFQEAIEKELG